MYRKGLVLVAPEQAYMPAVIDPYREALAYEYLYSERGSSLKAISSMTVDKGLLPSEAAGDRLFSSEVEADIQAYFDSKLAFDADLGGFGVAVDGTPQYPTKLHDANERVPLIYYRGDINLIERKSVSIVGARKASLEGCSRAARLARILAEEGICVVSGLAKGIDTAALVSAIKAGGRVIGVIGTPIDETYPRENASLHKAIAYGHLLVSQVPFYRYSKQPFNSKKCYFRERNITMAAISDATVIVEASDTSGSLIQAQACIKQGRPLFLMRSCLDNPDINWPARFVDAGARVLSEPEELLGAV